MKKIISRNLEETRQVARKLLDFLRCQEQEFKRGATVVCLEGDLGAGKTALVKVIAQELGIQETITSPTFVIQKKYRLENQVWESLIHIDAYRLGSGADLEILGFGKLLEENNLICIEWTNRVEEILPKNAQRVGCGFIDENTRSYEW